VRYMVWSEVDVQLGNRREPGCTGAVVEYRWTIHLRGGGSEPDATLGGPEKSSMVGVPEQTSRIVNTCR